jgi:hypothetical protein
MKLCGWRERKRVRAEVDGGEAVRVVVVVGLVGRWREHDRRGKAGKTGG